LIVQAVPFFSVLPQRAKSPLLGRSTVFVKPESHIAERRHKQHLLGSSIAPECVAVSKLASVERQIEDKAAGLAVGLVLRPGSGS
jgi:hypothetical protein